MTKKSVKRNQNAQRLINRMAALSVRGVPAPKRRPPRRRRMVRRARVVGGVDPFIHCVLGPLAQPGEGLGAPDGSVDPSVVIEHRQTVTVAPVGGNVVVALVSGPYGAIAVGEGTVTATLNNIGYGGDVPAFGTPTSHTVTHSITSANAFSNYETLPFVESLRSTGNPLDDGSQGLQMTHFRVLTTQAKVSYTGTTLADSGASATARVTYGIDEDVHNPMYGGGTGYGTITARGVRLPSTPPKSFSDVASLPGSRVFPTREPANLLNPPTDFGFQEIREGWAPFTQTGEGTSAETGNYGLWFPASVWRTDGTPIRSFGPIPGLGYAPISFYAAAGMADGASVTFEVRTCCEYRLAYSSPSARFARAPPEERPQALKAVKNMARNLPSSTPATPVTEQNGWLGNALSWYGNTMRDIVGGVWSTAGNLLQESRVPVASAFGQVLRRSGASLTGASSMAIGY